ncbi:MAG: metal ABC transporter permease [Chloroflexi bacterium]|nr:metal ABC transporter permease [Chloroflexota bacterium]
MPSIFQYEFMLRALAGGALVGVLAPILGTFVVLRRYSLIADTLAHVALMGVAIGLATRFLPALTALAAAVLGAIVVEQLRARGRLPGDAALAVVLYGSLAIAIVVISAAGGFNVDLFSFLFGSILSVSPLDLWLLAGLTTGVVIFVAVFYVDLAQLAFDEDLAKVSGVRTDLLNLVLAVLTGATITMSMRVVGVLLIGALLVIPVLTGMHTARGLRVAMGIAVAAGLVSAGAGLTIAFYGDFSAGGAIVITALLLLLLSRLWTSLKEWVRATRRQGAE